MQTKNRVPVNNMAGASSQQQQQHQQQQQPQLKCPRCDSSNTKFCYYNNYSLSQPRHFCKACKRYWTRGGTLRNVPVGGSYRKNKRSKRPASASTTSINGCSSNNPQNTSHLSSMNHPLFYGLSNHSNLPMIQNRFSNSTKTSSSGLESTDQFLSSGFSDLSGFENTINGGFINKPFILSGLFGSSSSSTSNVLQNPLKPVVNDVDFLGQSHLQTLSSLQDLHVGSNNEGMDKEEKLDQVSGFFSSSLDPSNYNNIWNPSVVNGAWLDPTSNNIGSSLTSLI